MSITTMPREQFELMGKPCVYTLRRRDGSILYIGMSKIGYSRPLSKHRTYQRDRQYAFSHYDSIQIETFETPEEAVKRERVLTHEHHPVCNNHCHYCCWSAK